MRCLAKVRCLYSGLENADVYRNIIVDPDAKKAQHIMYVIT